jgi:hypothetical protein
VSISDVRRSEVISFGTGEASRSMDSSAGNLLTAIALIVVVFILIRIEENWSEPKYKELVPRTRSWEPVSEIVEPEVPRWEEMEPEEDSQPDRFRRWDEE